MNFAKATPVLLAFVLACSPPGPEKAPKAPPPPSEASPMESVLLGGCILTSPEGQAPDDPYTLTEITPTGEYKPFTQELEVYGLRLVATGDVSDEFLRLVAKTIQEIFPRDEGMDLVAQAEILRNHHRYRALIPVPKGDDMSFVEGEPTWELTARRNTVCDIIMEGVPGQVMEVVEHILHYVTDVGLHYTFPDEWGLSGTSTLRRAMDKAIEQGYYVVTQYSDIEEPEVRDRVIVQEFAYWFISTAWNLQETYGPREAEWTIRNGEELKSKLPELYEAYERTVGRTMAPPSLATLREIGPTRAEEREAKIELKPALLAFNVDDFDRYSENSTALSYPLFSVPSTL